MGVCKLCSCPRSSSAVVHCTPTEEPAYQPQFEKLGHYAPEIFVEGVPMYPFWKGDFVIGYASSAFVATNDMRGTLVKTHYPAEHCSYTCLVRYTPHTHPVSDSVRSRAAVLVV